MANPDPEITPARRQGGAPRRDHRHRPLGLSQPGQQRARLPLHLPRRARRAGDDDQRGDEDRRRAGDRRARAPAGARRSRRRLWRQGPDVRRRLHHSGAVRSAADGGRVRRRSPRRRWTAASRRSRSRTWTPTAQRCKRRLNPTTSVLTLAYEAARANPAPGPLRRRRGGCRAARRDRSSATSATAFRCWSAATDVHDRLRELGVERSRTRSRSRTAATIRACRRWSIISTSGCSGAAILQRDVRADGQPGPQHLRRAAARARRGRRDDHRHHPHLCADYARDPPGARSEAGRDAVRHPPDGRPDPHRLPRRHDGQRAADRRAARRDRHPDRRRSPGGWGTSRASPSCPIRTSAIPTGNWLEQHPRRGEDPRPREDVDFEYEGEMAPDVALNPSAAWSSIRSAACPARPTCWSCPGCRSANISAKLLRELGGDAMIGPMLVGMEAAGPDRADDRDRVGPGDAGRARGGKNRPLTTRPLAEGEASSSGCPRSRRTGRPGRPRRYCRTAPRTGCSRGRGSGSCR